MAVKTSKVTGRRCLRFESLDAVLADAEYLASVETKRLGNWTLGQILMHLATVYEKSIDGTDFRPGWFLRQLAKVAMPLWKRWALRRGIPAGIRPPAFMFKEVAPPAQVDTEDGLRAFRRAITRLKSEGQRDWEQCFHAFTREEWDRFHMRHAELHLSYIVPVVELRLSPVPDAEPGAAADGGA